MLGGQKRSRLAERRLPGFSKIGESGAAFRLGGDLGHHVVRLDSRHDRVYFFSGETGLPQNLFQDAAFPAGFNKEPQHFPEVFLGAFKAFPLGRQAKAGAQAEPMFAFRPEMDFNRHHVDITHKLRL